MFRKSIQFLAGLCIWILLSGCAPQQHLPDEPIENESETLVVGVSVLDLANPYFVQIVEGIQNEAQKRDVKLIINDPKSDVEQQILAVEQFTKDGVDAIIIAALDQVALEESLGRAMEQGIKVVAQATKVENCDIYVSFSEWDMGYTIGQSAGKWISDELGGEAQVAILNYPQISQIARREKGIWDGIIEYAPNARLVMSSSAANPIEGKAATLDILSQYPEVQVIVGINDGGALGALNAFEELGLASNKVFVGGIDATPEAIKQIRDLTIYRATVDNSPYYSGVLDLDFAIKLINGQIVPDAHIENAKIVNLQNISLYD